MEDLNLLAGQDSLQANLLASTAELQEEDVVAVPCEELVILEARE